MVLFFQIQLFKSRVCKRTTNQATHSFADPVIVEEPWFALEIPQGSRSSAMPLHSHGCPLIRARCSVPFPQAQPLLQPTTGLLFLRGISSPLLPYFYQGLNGP